MDAPVVARREVSCLALTFFYDYLEKHGIPRRKLQEGLPYSPKCLDTRTNWIDYQTFLQIERRMRELLPDPNLPYDIGRTFGATHGFGFLRVIFRSVLSPLQMYELLPRLVKRFLFPFVTIEVDPVEPGHVRMIYSFDEGFPPTSDFLETVRGILAGVPEMLGLDSAEVRYVRTSERRAVFEVLLPTQTRLSDRARSGGRRVVGTLRLWTRNWRDAVTELEETNQLLQEKVTSLSILNALARVATSELDLGRLLHKVASLLSAELGDAPVAVLLSEGEPPAPVVAASVHLGMDDEDHLLGSEALQLALQGSRAEVECGGETYLLAPIRSRERTLAVLVVPSSAAAGREASFVESITAEVAVAAENALAFQTIADLRDNLEHKVQDRTAELEEARRQLELTVDQLRASDRARTEFFTNVSHELRTPLTLILAPLDQLEASLEAAGLAAGEDVRVIRRNALLLLRHINEILDFARLDVDRLPLRPETFDLHELAGEVVATLRPLGDKKSIALDYEAASPPLFALMDRALIRRVLFNLLENAIKYVGPDDRVRVAVEETEGEVVLEVSDTGPGIPAEFQSRIFERFQRVPDATGRVIEGSGIGLAMVKEIVELHHGAVSLHSAPGEGATFRVRLPRSLPITPPSRLGEAESDRLDEVSALIASLEGSPAPKETPGLDAAKGGGDREGRVLLVEDNDEMRGFLRRLLSTRFQVATAADGVDGLTRARAEVPDAIVSDVMMPKVSGLELCRQVKADPILRNVPVLLVSARHGSEAALEGFRAGADDYVVKPFSAPELLARVDAQIRIRQMTLGLMRMEKQTTLGTLSFGVAHEVLNPINAVINAVPPLRRAVDRLAQEHEDSRPARTSAELLDTIEKAGDRVQKIVRALLAFARQDELPQPQRVQVEELLESPLTILQFRLERVQVHQDLGWRGEVMCVPETIGQVLMNLITNAVDAMPGGGQLWLRTERADGTVKISVRDEGPGVPRELRERIFDPFFTTKPPGSGTGLGLAVSREIVGLHGGTLELNPNVDRGAEFVLTLPLQAPEVPSEPEAEWMQ